MIEIKALQHRVNACLDVPSGTPAEWVVTHTAYDIATSRTLYRMERPVHLATVFVDAGEWVNGVWSELTEAQRLKRLQELMAEHVKASNAKD